jgi:RNA polymerase sigma-70 factor (ECF subfamily)
MVDPDDQYLIQRARGGDMTAVGALYDEHHDNIFKYLWLRVGDRQVAEDLTGDVFIRMMSALPNYRLAGAPFRAWLYRIAHNLIVDHFRRANLRTPVPLEAIEEQAREDDPLAAVDRKLLVERLQHALSQLDQLQREVVALRFVVGLSLQEVAQVIGRSEAAVKSLQHRGLAALRRALSEEKEQVRL